MEESKWMIVKRETTSTKIKKFFKNMFNKVFNRNDKKKKHNKKEIIIEFLY